jgi:hypothetical protein
MGRCSVFIADMVAGGRLTACADDTGKPRASARQGFMSWPRFYLYIDAYRNWV